MNDDVWQVVKATPRVTGFVGTGTTADAAVDRGVDPDCEPRAGPAKKPRLKVSYEKNETVRITEGAFASLRAWWIRHEDRETLKVMGRSLGRSTRWSWNLGKWKKVVQLGGVGQASRLCGVGDLVPPCGRGQFLEESRDSCTRLRTRIS